MSWLLFFNVPFFKIIQCPVISHIIMNGSNGHIITLYRIIIKILIFCFPNKFSIHPVVISSSGVDSLYEVIFKLSVALGGYFHTFYLFFTNIRNINIQQCPFRKSSILYYLSGNSFCKIDCIAIIRIDQIVY